jgi:zinc protease
MSKIVLKRVFIAVLFLGFAQTVLAQTADEVIEKHFAALGGRATLTKLKSRSMRGTITVPTPVGEISGLIEVLNQEPNKSRTFIELDLAAVGGPGKMIQDQRFDGTTGYVIDSLQGNRDITGQQLDAMKNGSFPNPLLNYKEAGTTVELSGKEKLGERDAYVLVIKFKNGIAARQYIDAETYLPVKQVTKVNVPQIGQDIEQTTEMSDFRDVDGVKMPFRIKTSSSLQTIDVRISQVQHNIQIDQALFSKPTDSAK